MSAAERIASALGGKGSSGSWIALCPTHDDRKPSLSITDENGKVLVHCHAGCGQEQVIDRLKSLNLWPNERAETPRRTVARYVYCDKNGEPRYRVIRMSDKSFRLERADGESGYVSGAGCMGGV